MKRKFILFSILLLTLVVFYGCSHSLARFSVATTSNLPLTDVKKGENIEGKDCLYYFLGIPLGNTQNRISNAVGDALDKAHEAGQPADALVNVHIKTSGWSIILFSGDCVYAAGQPIAIGK